MKIACPGLLSSLRPMVSIRGIPACSNDPCPVPPCCGEGSSANPVRYAQGRILLSETDLDAGIPGFAHKRTFWNRSAGLMDYDGPLGSNWFVQEWPYLVERDNAAAAPGSGRTIILKLDLFPIFFSEDPKTGLWKGRYGAEANHFLVHDAASGRFIYTYSSDQRTEVIEFNDFEQPTDRWGMMHRRIDSSGYITTVSGYENESITALETVRGTTTFRLRYVRTGDPSLITEVFLEEEDPGGTPPRTLQKVEYQYKASGSYPLLEAAVISKMDSTGTLSPTDIFYYRYDETLVDTVVRPATYLKLKAAGQDPLTMPTGPGGVDLVPEYADKLYTYDESRRVVQEVGRENGSASTALSGETMTRSFNPRRGRERRYLATESAWNRWVWKTVTRNQESMTKTVYTNAMGSVLLSVTRDSQNPGEWSAHYIRYDKMGRVIFKANAGAVEDYDEGLDDLVGARTVPGESTPKSYRYLSSHRGQCEWLNWWGSTTATDQFAGGVEGYLQSRSISEGYAGFRVPQEERSWFLSPDSGSGPATARQVVPATETTFRQENDSADSVQTTSYQWQWHNGTVVPMVKERVTRHPLVSPSENGDGTTRLSREWFDERGNSTYQQDELGHVRKQVFEAKRDRLVQTVVDDDEVPTGSGWTPPGGPFLQLTTDTEYDHEGRPVLTLEPEHAALLNGVEETGRTYLETLYVERNANDQTVGGDLLLDRVIRVSGFFTAGGDGVYFPYEPYRIALQEKNGQVLHTITSKRSSGSGRLQPTDTFLRPEWLTWTSEQYDERGLLTAERKYQSIPPAPTGLDGVWNDTGTEGTNYDERQHFYADGIPREIRKVGFCGDVERMIYDNRTRLVAIWSGTNDVPSVPGSTWEDWVPGAPGTDLVQLTETEYDSGASTGPSWITAETQYARASEPRTVHYQRDYRGRIVGEAHPENLSYRFVLDNLGRTIRTDRLSGREDGLLVARTEEFFDERGRSYRRRIHAVNPTNGAITGWLDENLWHNARGDLVRQIDAGGGQKAMDYAYDGARRRIETATVALESHLEDEVVVESVQIVLSPAGTEEQRIHSELNAFATPQSPSYRISYTQSWWDGIGRLLARSSLGALPAAPTRPAVPPSSDPITLVSQRVYNSRGLLEDSITPAGKIERTEYDDRNRVARTIRNFIAPGDPGQPGPDANQTVSLTYTPNDQMAGFTVHFADPAKNQTTEHRHGTTLGPSEVASHSLLHEIVYPDGSIRRFEYSRTDEIITEELPDGTMFSRSYDLLGRMVRERATANGPGIQKDPSEHAFAYNSIGWVASAKVGLPTENDLQISQETQFDYDDYGQLWRQWQEVDGKVDRQGKTKALLYGRGGGQNRHRIKTLNYGNNRLERYSYGENGSLNDRLNRVAGLKARAEDFEAAHYEYLGLATVVRKVLDQPGIEFDLMGDIPGEYTGIDRFGRPVDWNWKRSSGPNNPVARIGHSYGLDSLRLTRTDPVAMAAGKDLDEQYVYDGLDQLVRVERPNEDLDWNYDEIGNWLRLENSETGTQDRTHNDLNQITGITETPPPDWITPVYDGNGRTTLTPGADDPTVGYHHIYNAWGQIVETWIPDPVFPSQQRRILRHYYDARGYRVRTQVHDPATGKLRYIDDFVYDQKWRPVVVERREPIPDSEGKLADPYVQRQFLWTPTTEYPDTLVRMDTRNTPGSREFQVREYALQDDHANTIATADSHGTLTQRWTYGAFGKANWLDVNFEPALPDPDAWPVLFSGYRIEDNTGLYQVRHRTYDSGLGRWLSRDPIGERGGLNLYGFVGNEPVGRWDLLGELFGIVDQKLTELIEGPHEFEDEDGSWAVEIAVSVEKMRVAGTLWYGRFSDTHFVGSMNVEPGPEVLGKPCPCTISASVAGTSYIYSIPIPFSAEYILKLEKCDGTGSAETTIKESLALKILKSLGGPYQPRFGRHPRRSVHNSEL